jgi:hypothetical protein
VRLDGSAGPVHVLVNGKDRKVLNRLDMGHGIKALIVDANSVISVRNETQLYTIGSRR